MKPDFHPERLDPQLAPFAAMFAGFLNLDDIPEQRKQLATLFAARPAATGLSDVQVSEHQAPALKRGPQVRLRSYRPGKAAGVPPCIYYVHGGGMVLGSIDQNDDACKALARDTNCMIVAVGYRLAPEHPYPAAMDDCYAGLKWVAGNTASLGIDPARIAVMGHSAGGGLAAGLALLARDKREVKLAFQLLVYPMIDDTNVKSAAAKGDDFYVWSRANNLAGWKAYLGSRRGTAKVPAYAAPARAKKLAGLPPAYICTGDRDLFLAEDLAYAQRLAAAGVPIDLHVYPGAFHGFDSLIPDLPLAQRATADMVRALRAALGT
jgi:acetyl esterase/lipase